MHNGDYSDKRFTYNKASLEDSSAQENPFVLFQNWMEDAYATNITEPNAMTLATLDSNHQPHARIVLLKYFDQNGFVFFSNYYSAKGQELSYSNKAALSFFWPDLEKQIRIEGVVNKINAKESDEYFASRPQDSQIGACISQQSQPLTDRAMLDKLIAEAKAKYDKLPIPRPEHWGGYRLTPASFEFWQGRPDRLHDRLKFTRLADKTDNWKGQRLFP